MKFFNWGNPKEALEDYTAEKIARGLRDGTNVAEEQQALNDSKRGDTTGLFRTIVGKTARRNDD